MISLTIPFLIQKPEFFCRVKNFPTEANSHCFEEAICNNSEIEFTKNLDNSLKNWAYDFDLFCDRAYLATIFGILYFLGGFIGVIFLGIFRE